MDHQLHLHAFQMANVLQRPRSINAALVRATLPSIVAYMADVAVSSQGIVQTGKVIVAVVPVIILSTALGRCVAKVLIQTRQVQQLEAQSLNGSLLIILLTSMFGCEDQVGQCS